MIILTDEDVVLVAQRYREKLERLGEEILLLNEEDEVLSNYYAQLHYLIQRNDNIGWREGIQQAIDMYLGSDHTKLEAKKAVGLL